MTNGAFDSSIARAIYEVSGFNVERAYRVKDFPRFCGFVLPGGGDVCPERYGMESNGLVFGTSERQDEADFAIAEYCRKHQVPVLGICRGHQVLGVDAGLQLIQDIGDYHTSYLGHTGHYIRGSLTSSGSIVNSLHHQAVPNLPSQLSKAGITVLASADNDTNQDDLIVEAMRSDYLISTQWHPELDWYKRSVSRWIFETFGAMVNARMNGNA